MTRSNLTASQFRPIHRRACVAVLGLVALIVAGVHAAQPDPDHDATIDELKARLGVTFLSYTTDHFHVLSDAEPQSARRLGALLEQTQFQFIRFCRQIGFEPDPVERKHPCILFAEREAFVKYAGQHDRIAESWVGGYFSNHGNYTAFYPADRDPALNAAHDQIAEWESQLTQIRDDARRARLERDADEAERLTEHERALSAHLREQRERLEDISSGRSDARVIHETVHLLAFNCGLQSRYRVPPFWITEGLATNFETDRAKSAFGPGFDYEARRTAIERAIREGRSPPLADVITITDMSQTDGDQAEILYSYAYSFFGWAYRFRREELARLFTRYAQAPGDRDSIPTGRIPASTHRAEFEAIFGPVSRVEREWLRWERSQIRPAVK